MSYPYRYLFLDTSIDDAVGVPAPSGMSFDPKGSFSIDAWIKLTDTNTTKNILSQEGGFCLSVRDDVLRFTANGYSGEACSGISLSVGEWYYVAVTSYRNVLSFFVDGGKPEDVSLSGDYRPSTEPLLIGKDFFGQIRHVRVYSRALTTDEVGEMRYGMGLTSLMSAFYDFTACPAVERRTGASLQVGSHSRLMAAAPSAQYTDGDFLTVVNPEDWRINPGGALNEPYTVQQWFFFQPVEGRSRYTLFSNTDIYYTGGMQICLVEIGGKYHVRAVHADFVEENNRIVSKAEVPAGTWVNAAVVYGGEELALYINGVLDGKHTEVKSAVQPLTSKSTIIGASPSVGRGNGEDWFSGSISRTDVWGCALTAEEISRYMKEEPDAQEELRASWSMFTRSVFNRCDFYPLMKANELRVADRLEKAAEGLSENHGPLDGRCWPEPLSREELCRCRRELMERLRAEGLSDGGEWTQVSRLVSSFRRGETVYFVLHDKDSSYTVASIDREKLGDELTEWRIEVLLTLLSSLVELLLSVHLSYNPWVAAFIADSILTLTSVRDAFATVKEDNKASVLSFIYEIIRIMLSENRLIILIRMAARLSFWGILVTVAKLAAKMLNPVAALGMWAASLVVTIIYLYRKKPRENPEIVLNSITFHHGIPGYVDSIAIRKNATEEWNCPEWQDTCPESAPAVYRLSSFSDGRSPSIAVKLQGSYNLTGTFTVRGIMVHGSSELLGPVPQVTVKFIKGHLLGEKVVIPLTGHTMRNAAIQTGVVSWKWQYWSNNRWNDIRITSHRIYTILDSVNAPWSRGGLRAYQGMAGSKPNEPWTDVLDMLMSAVGGRRSRDELMAEVTRYVYGRMGLCYVGGPYWTIVDGNTGMMALYLREFMQRGEANRVNCQDCASLVAAFANLLGCNMGVMEIIGQGQQPYQVNKVLLIGENRWRYPISDIKGEGFFDYHYVAVPLEPPPARDDLTLVYDACLKYNGADDPWGEGEGSEELACGVPFSRYDNPQVPITVPVKKNSYREHTCANTEDGIGLCRRHEVKSVNLIYQ